MPVDPDRWRLLGNQVPKAEWQTLTNGAAPALSTAVETFLVEFQGLPPNRANYELRSKLVLRVVYPTQSTSGDFTTREFWIKPSREPQELTIEFPVSLLINGTIFRQFESRRWNRYGRRFTNTDGDWGFYLYESKTPRSLDDLPSPPDQPPDGPQWEWIPPNFD